MKIYQMSGRIVLSLIFFQVLFFQPDFQGMAQDSNDQPILMGRTSFRTLMVRPYFDWFRKPYDDYVPNPSALDVLRQKSSGISFLVFGGTWCEDTQKLLPLFVKVTDLAGISRNRVTLYFTDRDKHTPEGLENQYGVTRVPTFIMIKNGVEVGRITESVSQSVEADLADLLSR
jgi:thiol-disulfide isomerase/thioredoxin